MAQIIKFGKSDDFASAIFQAVRKGDDALAMELIAACKDPNEQSHWGNTALHHAVFADRVAVVRALLEAGVDPNLGNSWNSTPLMGSKSVEVVRLLLAAGADANAATIENRRGMTAAGGETALMCVLQDED